MDPNFDVVEKSSFIVKVSSDEGRVQEVALDSKQSSVTENEDNQSPSLEDIRSQLKSLDVEISNEIDGRSFVSEVERFQDEIRIWFELINKEAYVDVYERLKEARVIFSKIKQLSQKDIETSANAAQIILEMLDTTLLVLDYLDQLNQKQFKLHKESLQLLQDQYFSELKDIQEADNQAAPSYDRNNDILLVVNNVFSSRKLWSVPTYVALTVLTLFSSNISAGIIGNFVLSLKNTA